MNLLVEKKINIFIPFTYAKAAFQNKLANLKHY
jgi:hypothetical protein